MILLFEIDVEVICNFNLVFMIKLHGEKNKYIKILLLRPS